MSKNRLHRSGADDYPPPWELGPISVERWQKHRDRMIENAKPGRRPQEWWLYDQDMDVPERGHEAEILLEMGELTESELEGLMHWWRMDYDHACEVGLSSAAGRHALRGIPRTIRAQLKAERRCRSKTTARALEEAPGS